MKHATRLSMGGFPAVHVPMTGMCPLLTIEALSLYGVTSLMALNTRRGDDLDEPAALLTFREVATADMVCHYINSNA